MGEPLRVGMIGVGAISAQYLATFARLDTIELVAVADLDAERAAAVALATSGVRALSVDALLDDSEVELVLNLTIPAAHADVALAAIAAGKSVYGEKPLATSTEQARRVLDAATKAGVRIGCAPDTVLGTGTQTARVAIDDGLIGRPISASATMVTPGHERWHPNPDFYYQPGGGPLFDMGPYYLSSLVTLLGPVASVVGASNRTRETRAIETGARAGERVPVDIDTHLSGILTHESGAISTLVMSFDAVATAASHIEVHGEAGSLIVPDPNTFAGDVQIATLTDAAWRSIAPTAGYVGATRGFGISDLAATAPGDEPRAGGQLAFHVLDIMESLQASANGGRSVAVGSRVGRPSPVPLTVTGN